MTYYASKDVKLLVGGYDVTSDLEGVNYKVSAVLDEVMHLGNAWPTQYDTGQRRAEIGCNGIYNSVSGSTPILAYLSGTNKVVSLVHEDGTAGTRCWNLPTAMVSGVEPQFEQEKIHRLATEFAITGKAQNGYVVAPLTARTTDGNTDDDDVDGEASSTGATAFLHITSIDAGGGSGVTVTVRSSSDASSYADCSSSFTIADSIGAEAITLTGTVERYLSISWAWTGGTSPTFTGFVSVARD